MLVGQGRELAVAAFHVMIAAAGVQEKQRMKRLLWGACLASLAFSWIATSSFAEGARAEDEAARWEHSAITSLRGKQPGDDVSSQVEDLHKAAAAGRPVAQFELGRLYREGKWVPKDDARGLQLIEAAARGGLAPAQARLGWIYASAESGDQGLEKAERWLIAAAKQGDPFAARLLALLYFQFERADINRDVPERLLRRAAELADDDARVMYGWMLLQGELEQKDDPKLAEYLLLQAAKTGHANAAYLLGTEYLSGAALRIDLSRGVHWISKAHEQKHTLATLRLSDLSERGVGVESNAELAEELLVEALSHASLPQKNDFAWALSVSPKAHMRNPSLAVRIMEPALAAPDAEIAAFVDTLAAAHAAMGNFDAAVESQLRALHLAREEKRSAAMLAQLQRRLDLYRQKQPFYEEHP